MDINATKQIIARYIDIEINPIDLSDVGRIHRQVDAFLSDVTKIDSVLLTDSGRLLLYAPKKMSFNSGLFTIRKKMKLSEMPTRHVHDSPLPDAFFREIFPTGYEENRVVFVRGRHFEGGSLQRMVERAIVVDVNRITNATLLEVNAIDLVKSGTIKLNQLSQVVYNKDLFEKLSPPVRPDLIDDYVLTFGARDLQTGEKAHNYIPIKVTISCDPTRKLRHHWIYSKFSGFGKSHEFRDFRQMYNACVVNDLNNWTNVSPNAQVLIFEEWNYLKCLRFEAFKTLCDVDASSFAGNCKTYGKSFQPRSDVIVIVLSNCSPYDVYGGYNRKLGRRFISEDIASQIESRLIITRLDGSVLDDRIEASLPTTWSDQVFLREIERLFTEMKSPTNAYIDASIERKANQMVNERVKTLSKTWHLITARNELSGEGHLESYIERDPISSVLVLPSRCWVEHILSPCARLLTGVRAERGIIQLRKLMFSYLTSVTNTDSSTQKSIDVLGHNMLHATTCTQTTATYISSATNYIDQQNTASNKFDDGDNIDEMTPTSANIPWKLFSEESLKK